MSVLAVFVIIGLVLPQETWSFHSIFSGNGGQNFISNKLGPLCYDERVRRLVGISLLSDTSGDNTPFISKCDNNESNNISPQSNYTVVQHHSFRRKKRRRHKINKIWLEEATKMLLSSDMGSLTQGRWYQVVSLFKAWSELSKDLEHSPLRMESLLTLLVEERKRGNSQVVITIDMYNSLLDAWACSGLFKATIPPELASQRAREILVLLQESYERGDDDLIMPNEESFQIVFHCVCRIEGAVIARRLLAWMEYLVRSGKNKHAKPIRLYYIMILDSYANSDAKNAPSLVEGFIRHINSLKTKECSRVGQLSIDLDDLMLPDTYCYNMLLKAWNRQVLSNRRDGREAAEEADRILEEMKELNVDYCKPDLITYTSVVTAWTVSGMKSHAVQKAEALLREIENSSDLEANTIVLNAVMSTWVKSRNPSAVDRTEEIIKQMEDSYDARPDLTSYNTHLHALSMHSHRSVQNVQKAEMILEKLEESCDKGLIDFGPNRFTYNLVLEAICKSTNQENATTKAAFVLRKLIQRQNMHPDVQPDTYSFNQVLTLFSKNPTDASAQTAANLLQYMNKASQTGVFPLAKPDSDSYFAVINAYARSGGQGSAHRATMLLNEMKCQYADGNIRLKPTRTCYNTVIDSWARSGEGTLGARKAESLLQEMQLLYEEGDKDMSPTVYTYNSVLYAWARSGTRCCGYKAEQYLERMWETYNAGDVKVKPNDFSYNTVINAISKSKNERKAQKALRILRKMDKLYQAGSNEARPNEITYTAVLNSCAFPAALDSKTKRKALDTAVFTLKELQSSQYAQPNQVTYGTFIKACQNLLDEDDNLRRVLIKNALEECIKDGQVGPMVLSCVPRDLVNELLTGYMTSEPKLSLRWQIPPEWTCNLNDGSQWKARDDFQLKKRSNRKR